MHAHDYYGDKFKWFIGVAKELSADGTKVRVRVYGIHRMDDTTDVSDGDLPYAVVLTPTTGGEGMNSGQQIGIQNGDWVMGFFADGDDCMQPVVVGVVGGGMGSDATTSGTGIGSDGGSGNGNVGGEYTPDRTIPGGSIEHQAYNFLRSRWESIHGDSDQAHCQACGMMGHMYVESAKWNLKAFNRGEQAYGVCQWRGDRLARLRALSGHVQHPALSQQLSFCFWEYEHTHKSAYRRMLAAHTTADAVYAFSYFELHAGVTGRGINMAVARSKAAYGTRLGQALMYDRVFKNQYIRPEYGPNRGADQSVSIPSTGDSQQFKDYTNRGGGTR